MSSVQEYVEFENGIFDFQTIRDNLRGWCVCVSVFAKRFFTAIYRMGPKATTIEIHEISIARAVHKIALKNLCIGLWREYLYMS